MKKIALITFCFISTICLSQEFKFGKISKEELKEAFYPLDSTADASYLFRKRTTYYNFNNSTGSFDVITKIFNRIKIYTKDGFKKATIELPYYNPESGEEERISGIKAYTFNLKNNKVEKSKLSGRDVFKEQVSQDWSIKKFTLPDIKEGSVLDIEYKIVSPYFYKIDDIEFQFDIPVKKLDYSISIPEYYKFSKFSKGYYGVTPVIEKKYKSLTITSKTRSGSKISQTTFENSKFDYTSEQTNYDAENIPALKSDEKYVYSFYNYRGGIKYELTQTNFLSIGGGIKSYATSWENVSKQVYSSRYFGNELNRKGFYKKEIDEILQNVKTDPEKIIAIFQYIKSRIKWNGKYGKFTQKGVRLAFKENQGNVADINLLLTSILRYAGLNANPVLVSSKGNGAPLFPSADGFDYVISIVNLPNNSYVLLDATEPYSLPNLLPVRVLNWQGRVIYENGNSSWVNLTSQKHATEANIVTAKITEDLEVEGLVRTSFKNLNALNFRSSYNHLDEKELITKYEENNNLEIDEYKISNKNTLGKPVIRYVKFVSEDLIEQINNKIYIEPLLFLTKRENPFKLNERKFPVDFATAWEDTDRVTLEIPNGYKVESVPEAKAIALPDNLGVFKYQIIHAGNSIKTLSSLQFNSPIIPAKYYKYLKDFYSQLVKKETEKIVLVKI